MIDWITGGTSEALAWLLTYGIHSTILLLGAWLLTSRTLRSDGAREVAWRTALVGGLITATGQRLIGGGAIEAPTVTLHAIETGSAGAIAGAVAREPAPAGTPLLGGPLMDGVPLEALALRPHPDAPARPEIAATAPLERWPQAVLVGGAAMIMLGILALGARLVLLRRHLAGRKCIDDLEVVRCLRRLERDAGRRRFTRLTTSTSIDSPIAFGVLRPEICLPMKAVRLPLPLIETMLAHELAHVSRRDPLWLLVSRLMETAFVFQPLNRLASRRLGDLAEYRCDAWAAKLTGSPIGLARCLTEVAGWVRPAAPPLVSAMAVQTSRLEERVDRLLQPDEHERRGRRGLTAMLCVMCVAGVAIVGPGVAPGAAPAITATVSTTEATALAALDEELQLLDEEIAALARRLGGHPSKPELIPLLDRLQMHGATLRARRSALTAIELDPTATVEN